MYHLFNRGGTGEMQQVKGGHFMPFKIGTPCSTVVEITPGTWMETAAQILADYGAVQVLTCWLAPEWAGGTPIVLRIKGDTPSQTHWSTSDQVGEGITMIQNASRSLPLIALGASNDQTIIWPTPFPSASYAIKPAVASALAGNATVSVVSQTASQCVVRTTANVLLAAGTILDVIGYV